MHSIEAARGIAALMVALMHCGHLMRIEHFSGHIGLGGIFDLGYVGVDFFFVLSGFIITYVNFADIGHPERIGLYLWRRATRIYPIYWFCLLLSIGILVAGRAALGKGGGLDFTAADIAGTLFLLPTSEPKFVEVAWSLQFEVMFYAAFCVLLWNRRFGLYAISIWAIAIILRLLSGYQPSWAGLISASSLQFIMGIGIGFLARTPDAIKPPKGGLALSIGFFVIATLIETHVLPAHSDLGRILLGLASAAILWCLVELEKQHRIRTPRALAALGSVSYSVYLTHILFINLTFSILAKFGLYHRLPEIVVFGLGLAGGLVASLCIGFFVELPMVNGLKRMVGKRDATSKVRVERPR